MKEAFLMSGLLTQLQPLTRKSLWMPFIEHEGTFMYRENEMEKKRTYGDRILNVEKGFFTLLIFTKRCFWFSQRQEAWVQNICALTNG